MSDSEEDAAVLEWNMLDDMQWRLRPGFRFPHLMQQQTRHASQQSDAGQELRPDSWHVNFDGKVLESARAYLRRWGAREGWIVEVFPDRDHPEYEPGDRWFMTITNGLVQGPETAQHITACKWMKKNSVATLDSRWRQPESCEILQVKAYGPPDCRLFKAFNQ
jgi:hypothetical protein